MQSHRGVYLLQATQYLKPPEVYARPPQLPQVPLSLDANKTCVTGGWARPQLSPQVRMFYFKENGFADPGLTFLWHRRICRIMPGNWEVRGLFGNEFAMETAIDGLKKLEKVPDFKVLDRRNLQVVLNKDDTKSRDLVKNVIKIAHGYVESDAPLGRYDAIKAEKKAKKMKEYEEKVKAATQQKKH